MRKKKENDSEGGARSREGNEVRGWGGLSLTRRKRDPRFRTGGTEPAR
jgi:hypothetical protein